VRSRLFVGYAVAQFLAIAGFLLVPTEGWAHTLWQLTVGWGGAAFAVVGIHRHKPAGRLLFYLLAAGVSLNCGGILAAALLAKNGVTVGPSAADALYLGIFPCFVAGMALLIRRRSSRQDRSTLVDTTIITTGLGLLSWVFIIRPSMAIPGVQVVNRAVILAYPIGDLIVLAMMVRLLLGGGARNGSFRLTMAAMLGFLAADVGWAVFGQLGFDPSPFIGRIMESMSLAAYALVGASVLHSSVSETATSGIRQEARIGRLLIAGLTVASLIAPAVLLAQALRGHVVDGVAIAASSTVLFLLVVTRMTQLLGRLQERTRELAERNRAVRLVMDTVNEGLLRLSPEGWMASERSAMIDRWFGGFAGRVSFFDYINGVDPLFAQSFKLGHEALIEEVLPLDLCLAQLPARLRAKGREYKVSYLPVEEGGRRNGLLVVINDVTEQLALAQQDAEQRELVAALQAFTRDRIGFLTFFDEANQLAAKLVPGVSDPVSQKRHLHTLKGNASLLSLELLTRLCHEAEDEIDAGLETPATTALEALLARWAALSQSFLSFVGERGRETIEVTAGELDVLAAEVRRGLPSAAMLERLAAWRCEPVERAFERLAGSARALARRLGKGEVEIQVEASGLRLDPRRWAPLWSEMVHIIRNAVDHGFEGPLERRKAGKPPRPRLHMSASLRGDRLIIELADDGRGVDWDAVRAAATLRGLPVATEKDLVEALLAPGLSTSTEVSVVSGRGIGMSAVAARVEELAGDLAVESQRGVGTRWRLTFPASALDPREAASSVAA
jgi:two-component system chemotaxis sensor kinase CheA